MRSYKDHLIRKGSSIKQALAKLDVLASDAILFVVDQKDVLIGSLTDGDVRRGLLKDYSVEHRVEEIVQQHPKFILKGCFDINEIIDFRKQNFKIIPVVDADHRILNVINFRLQQSYLPLDAIIMAGGRGTRLQPLTDTTPKPLLKIGDKPIIEHNIDRLIKFGIDDIWISVNYLGKQIEDYFKDGSDRNARINYVREDLPLGTIGAVSGIRDFRHNNVLITNSDILTTLDYEDFFLDFMEKGADMSVVTIPYEVNIPYAVMETSNNHVLSFKEKPTYTYYSNGGIYLVKKEILGLIPNDSYFNATDLMQQLIEQGGKLISYPIRQYWLDIGRPEDFQKAKVDIYHLNL